MIRAINCVGLFAHQPFTWGSRILLAGCSPDDSDGDKKNCYKKMDKGWGNDAVPTMYRDGINNANTTVLDMIGMKSDVRKHFHWIPKRLINAYPDGHFWGKFKPGSPYVHRCAEACLNKWVPRVEVASSEQVPTDG